MYRLFNCNIANKSCQHSNTLKSFEETFMHHSKETLPKIHANILNNVKVFKRYFCALFKHNVTKNSCQRLKYNASTLMGEWNGL